MTVTMRTAFQALNNGSLARTLQVQNDLEALGTLIAHTTAPRVCADSIRLFSGAATHMWSTLRDREVTRIQDTGAHPAHVRYNSAGTMAIAAAAGSHTRRSSAEGVTLASASRASQSSVMDRLRRSFCPSSPSSVIIVPPSAPLLLLPGATPEERALSERRETVQNAVQDQLREIGDNIEPCEPSQMERALRDKIAALEHDKQTIAVRQGALLERSRTCENLMTRQNLLVQIGDLQHQLERLDLSIQRFSRKVETYLELVRIVPTAREVLSRAQTHLRNVRYESESIRQGAAETVERRQKDLEKAERALAQFHMAPYIYRCKKAVLDAFKNRWESFFDIESRVASGSLTEEAAATERGAVQRTFEEIQVRELGRLRGHISDAHCAAVEQSLKLSALRIREKLLKPLWNETIRIIQNLSSRREMKARCEIVFRRYVREFGDVAREIARVETSLAQMSNAPFRAINTMAERAIEAEVGRCKRELRGRFPTIFPIAPLFIRRAAPAPLPGYQVLL